MPRTTSRIRVSVSRTLLPCVPRYAGLPVRPDRPLARRARAQGLHRQFLREEGRACMRVGGRYAEDHVVHPCVRVEDASSLRASLRWSTSASGPPSCTGGRARRACTASPCARRVVLA